MAIVELFYPSGWCQTKTYIPVISRRYQHWIVELSRWHTCKFWLLNFSFKVNRIVLVPFKRGIFISIIIFAFITRLRWFLVLLFALPVVMVLIFSDLILNVWISFCEQYKHFLHFVFSVYIHSSWSLVLHNAIQNLFKSCYLLTTLRVGRQTFLIYCNVFFQFINEGRSWVLHTIRKHEVSIDFFLL